jgi:hypothetical protein
VGSATSSLVALCGYLTRHGTPKEGDPNYKQFKIGVHLGIILPIVYAGLFSWRAYLSSKNPEKMYLVKKKTSNVSLIPPPPLEHIPH